MKTLLILRHAKSSWADPGQNDYDRPLNKRGRRAAPVMGRLLAEEGIVPELIASSTAARARETTELVIQASRFDGDLEWVDSFYLAPPSEYIRYLSEVVHAGEIAMVVGHNPGLEELSAILTGRTRTFPTGALARISFDIDEWSELESESRGELVELYLPREHGGD